MATTDQTTYLTGVGDQLAAAVARGDLATAETIVDQVDADGHTAAAAALGHALDRTSIGMPEDRS